MAQENQIIYVKLLGEDIDVWRPVLAQREEKITYKIIDEMPVGEQWEYASGVKVIVEIRQQDGREAFYAIQKV